MRRSTFIAMVVAAVLAGLYGLSQGDRAEEGSRRVTATATTASTVRTTSTSTTSTSIEVLGEVATTTSTTAPSVAAVSCRNSADPACGSFYWDPQPVADRPLMVDVRFTPEQPRVGDEVTFEITYVDPDAPELACTVLAFGDDASPTHCDSPQRPCGRYGPWTPPAPQPLEARQVEVHVYNQPGTYEVLVGATSRTPGVDASCVDSRTQRPGDPFGATAQVRLPISISA